MCDIAPAHLVNSDMDNTPPPPGMLPISTQQPYPPMNPSTQMATSHNPSLAPDQDVPGLDSRLPNANSPPLSIPPLFRHVELYRPPFRRPIHILHTCVFITPFDLSDSPRPPSDVWGWFRRPMPVYLRQRDSPSHSSTVKYSIHIYPHSTYSPLRYTTQPPLFTLQPHMYCALHLWVTLSPQHTQSYGSPPGQKIRGAGVWVAVQPSPVPQNEATSQTRTAYPSQTPSLSRFGAQRGAMAPGTSSYHPKLPAHRSEWVMWVGNVPSDVTPDELRVFFNRPPESSSQSRQSPDLRQVYGGVSSVFLIARSNCAFVNFESEAQLEAAIARFHGKPIHPDNLPCPRLVCRVRKRTDDLKAGVGAQRGNSMHYGFGNLSRYFPRRYFVLKSLTQHQLDLSVQTNVWATQQHNEEILDQAYRTSEDVFLVFSVNKSGDSMDMHGPILHGEDRVPRASVRHLPSSSPLSAVSDMEETHPSRLPQIDEEDQIHTTHVSPEVSSAPAELHDSHHRLSHPTKHGCRSSRAFKSLPFELNADAPYRAIRGTRSNIHQAAHPIIPAPSDESEDTQETLKTAGQGSEEGFAEALGRPFRVDWIRTERLSFFRTKHLRNPWNHGREVKISRDGTELEPSEWDKRPPSPADAPAPTSRIAQRRRGSKST
ncbi:YT521-B-like domain-containing protein [Russula vinacea]|nr:YT521-B-like domain-containing protein [Russula vinacea]